MKLIVLNFVLFFAACTGASVTVEERYSNERAETAVSALPNHGEKADVSDAQKLLSAKDLFTRLKSRTDSQFDWARWWQYLVDQHIELSRDDHAGWAALFELKEMSCADEGPLRAFTRYLSMLRRDQVFLPPELPLSQIIGCLHNKSDSFRFELLVQESKEEFKNWDLIDQILSQLPSDFLAQQDSVVADRLVKAFEEKVVGTQGEPGLSSQRAVEKILKQSWISSQSRRSLDIALQSSQVADKPDSELNRLRIEALRSSMADAFESDQLPLWWASYSSAMIRNLKSENAFSMMNLVGEFLIRSGQTTAIRRELIRNHIEEIVDSMDDILDAIYRTLVETEGLPTKFEEQIARAKSYQVHELWMLTLLNGSPRFHNQSEARGLLSRLDKMFRETGSPVEQWYAYRMLLRSRFAQPLTELISVSDPHPETKTWWSDLLYYDSNLSIRLSANPETDAKEICPIPRFENQAGMHFDRPFQILNSGNRSSRWRGCFRIGEGTTPDLSNASYDTLIYAPSSPLKLRRIDRALIDLSGKISPKFSAPLLPAQDGKVLPIIFLEKGKNLPTRRWFVFQAIVTEPLPERLADGSSMVPPVSESSGDLDIFYSNRYPIWYRAFASPAVSGLRIQGAAKPAQAIAMVPDRIPAAIARTLGSDRLDPTRLAPAYEMREFNLTGRIDIPVELILSDHFEPLSFDDLSQIYSHSMGYSRDISDAEEILKGLKQSWQTTDPFELEIVWNQWITSQLKDFLKSNISVRNYEAFSQRFLPNPSNKLVVKSIEPVGLGPDGLRGRDGKSNQDRFNIFIFKNSSEARNTK